VSVARRGVASQTLIQEARGLNTGNLNMMIVHQQQGGLMQFIYYEMCQQQLYCTVGWVNIGIVAGVPRRFVVYL
jgi:hypothetical protein